MSLWTRALLLAYATIGCSASASANVTVQPKMSSSSFLRSPQAHFTWSRLLSVKPSIGKATEVVSGTIFQFSLCRQVQRLVCTRLPTA